MKKLLIPLMLTALASCGGSGSRSGGGSILSLEEPIKTQEQIEAERLNTMKNNFMSSCEKLEPTGFFNHEELESIRIVSNFAEHEIEEIAWHEDDKFIGCSKAFDIFFPNNDKPQSIIALLLTPESFMDKEEENEKLINFDYNDYINFLSSMNIMILESLEGEWDEHRFTKRYRESIIQVLNAAQVYHLSFREEDDGKEKLFFQELAPDLHSLRSLKSLYISKPSLIDIETISKMDSLESLHVEGNISLNSIGEMKNLKELGLSSREDDQMDISFIQNLPNLESLYLEANIKDLKYVSHVEKLKILEMARMDLTNIDFVSPLSNLMKLDLTSNRIQDITPLTKLPSLKSLILSGQDVKEFTCNGKSVLKNTIQEYSPEEVIAPLKTCFQ